MRHVALAILVVATACTQQAVTPSASPTAALVSVQPSLVPTPTATPARTPDPTTAPTQPPALDAPSVTVAPGTFPILTTLRTRLAVVDDALVALARGSVQLYLSSIDQYRNGNTPALPISGPFLAAVSTALKESAAPGVQRQFALESIVVDRHVQKPWGTHAYVDVTVTIVDRAIGGSAPDQRETGKLRLTSERLRVTDGWDEANGRWFNGFGPLPLEQVRSEIVMPLGSYLRLESWAPGQVGEPWRAEGDESTPFTRARAQRLAAIDRTRTVAQTFDGVTATIEKFETIEGLWSGLATVRLNGTRVTTDASGSAQRTPYEKRVRVFLFGGWAPEVVDEEASPGVWLSGGELALEKIDVDRA